MTISPLDALLLGSVYWGTFAVTRGLLGEDALPHWRAWIDLGFYLVATVGGGLFFSWLTRSVLKLRAHEHRQNNAQHILVLASAEVHEDLTAIRQALGIPRDDA